MPGTNKLQEYFRRSGPAGKLIVIVLAFIIFCWVIQLLEWRIDVTTDQRFTLSPESREVIASLEKDVSIRFYYTDSTSAMPLPYQDYSARVKDLLEEIARVSRDKIEIQVLYPYPDSQAEQSAKLDGVAPFASDTIDDLYMGIAFSCADRKGSIPVLNPEGEAKLEYEIMSQIHRVVNRERQTIGIYTDIPFFGIQDQFSEAPILFKLREDYDIVQIEAKGDAIEDVDILIVMHPLKFNENFDEAVRAHLKKGKSLVALVDPVCISWLLYNLPMTRENMSSHWPLLDEITGLSFAQEDVVLDMNFRGQINRGSGMEDLNYLLSVDRSGLNPKHSSTGKLNAIQYFVAGAFRGTPSTDFVATELVRSTSDSMLYDKGERFLQDGPELSNELMNTFLPDDNIYAMSILLEASKDSNSVGSGTKIFLCSDCDFINGPIPGNVEEVRGRQNYQSSPSNQNTEFFLNIIDQMVQVDSLSLLRSKTSALRPLEKIQEIQRTAEKAFSAKVRELSLLEKDYQSQIDSILKFQHDGGVVDGSTGQNLEEKLDELEALQDEAGRELRNVRRQQKHAVESIETKMRWLNIFVAPAIVAIFSCFILYSRFKATLPRQ